MPLQSEIKLEIYYTLPSSKDAHEIHIDLDDDDDYDESNANGVVLTNEFLDIPLTIARRSAPSIVTNRSGTNSSNAEVRSTVASQDDRAEITDCLEGKEYVKIFFMSFPFSFVINFSSLCHPS